MAHKILSAALKTRPNVGGRARGLAPSTGLTFALAGAREL